MHFEEKIHYSIYSLVSIYSQLKRAVELSILITILLYLCFEVFYEVTWMRQNKTKYSTTKNYIFAVPQHDFMVCLMQRDSLAKHISLQYISFVFIIHLFLQILSHTNIKLRSCISNANKHNKKVIYKRYM